jgi:hypothetical protein
MKECHDCGSEYKRISTHWSRSSCNYPNLSEKHHEIITGMMMGDAWAEGNDNNDKARIRIESITKPYLEYLQQELKPVSGEVSLRRTAEEMVESLGGDIENTNHSYKLDTMYHPELTRYRQWYESGQKVWPKELQLTPTALKHWYCGDGHYNNAGSNRHIKISMSNEYDNTEKVSNMFKRIGFDTANYNIQSRRDGIICDLTFTVDETERLFDYMGDPLPGFEYKWP